MKLSIGLVGVGAMGLGMTQSLLRNGFKVWVHDVNPMRNQLAAQAGANVCDSAASVACQANIVITVVVDAKQTRDVCFGEKGICEGMLSSGVVMVCSTIAPQDMEAISKELASRNILLLDAPISGGPVRAQTGSISMMLAGPTTALVLCESVLTALSDKQFVISQKAGDGSRMKLVNNLMAGINLIAAAEAFSLGIMAGLDPQKIFAVVQSSSGQSWMADDRMKRIIGGDKSVKAAVPILTKDVGLALDFAKTMNFPLPIGSQAHQIFQSTLALGHAHEDDNAVIRYYQALTGIDLP